MENQWAQLSEEEVPPFTHITQNDFSGGKYTLENDDEAFPTLSFKPAPQANVGSCVTENGVGPEIKVEAATDLESQLLFSAQNVAGGNSVETEKNKKAESSNRSQPAPKKQRGKSTGKKHASSKPVAELFKSKKVQEEIRRAEELKNKATSDLNSLYDEIHPTILAHKSNQDNVPTSVAEKWIAASCNQMTAEANYMLLHSEELIISKAGGKGTRAVCCKCGRCQGRK